ncbi:hypothetical protein [Flammeovirga kamogawensis]|nr:hypothetical protein [Flammeovirga kamogawensis]MBB6463797.1 hypothetical protein [Flammeovirga kamogawensis]
MRTSLKANSQNDQQNVAQFREMMCQVQLEIEKIRNSKVGNKQH